MRGGLAACGCLRRGARTRPQAPYPPGPDHGFGVTTLWMLSDCPGPLARGGYAALAFYFAKSAFFGAFVWVRRALNDPKRRFPARAVGPNPVPDGPKPHLISNLALLCSPDFRGALGNGGWKQHGPLIRAFCECPRAAAPGADAGDAHGVVHLTVRALRGV